MDFSVCMSVYKNDKTVFVAEALDSILNQTVRPSEIVLIVDGVVPPELKMLLCEYEINHKELFRIIWLPENKGLGNALNIAIKESKYELIARMDSDDIAVSNRFEKQLKYFEENPSLSIIGGAITEFIGTPDNVVGRRICPLENEAIKKYMKRRCGFSHMTVMFRKSEVLRAGNYQDWFWNEDYYLWIRMQQIGCVCANLPDILVNVRVGKDMYQRRGGWKYFKSEAKLQKYMLENKMISIYRFIYNVSIRFAVQVLMPNTIRGWIFRKFARKQ